MTTPPRPNVGVFSFLKEGAAAASKLVGDMELEKKLSPALDSGKQAAQRGMETVARASGQAREVVSQEKLWGQQRELVDQLIDVLTLQQGLIEDLRARVASLEAPR
jgi:hypothetical protein